MFQQFVSGFRLPIDRGCIQLAVENVIDALDNFRLAFWHSLFGVGSAFTTN